jgi:serpin B
MKRILIFACLIGAAVACQEQQPVGPVELDDAFAIEQPVPGTVLTRLALDETQKGYVREGNKLAFNLLKQLSQETSGSFLCSPLSLQLALAMTVNGAEGKTAEEMLGVLGYGSDGLSALNAYARLLIEQLPALDPEVTVRLADAILTTDRYPLNTAFRSTLKEFYYAPAASMSFQDPASVLAQVNEWARRNTGGLIDPMLKEMNPNAVAYLMNALYFKARWKGGETNPMFLTDVTRDDTFYKGSGGTVTVPFMASSRYFPYADKGTYEMVALPYASGKFFFYILLPKQKNGLDALLKTLSGASWNDLIASLSTDTEVHLRLPKFDVSGDFELSGVLQALGMRRAFNEAHAEFGGMFDAPESPGFYISRVLQKAKMTLAEWGTEAAAVTVVEIAEKSAMPGKVISFVADHPFVFVIGEQESGTILFEGVYTGV